MTKAQERLSGPGKIFRIGSRYPLRVGLNVEGGYSRGATMVQSLFCALEAVNEPGTPSTQREIPRFPLDVTVCHHCTNRFDKLLNKIQNIIRAVLKHKTFWIDFKFARLESMPTTVHLS